VGGASRGDFAQGSKSIAARRASHTYTSHRGSFHSGISYRGACFMGISYRGASYMGYLLQDW